MLKAAKKYNSTEYNALEKGNCWHAEGLNGRDGSTGPLRMLSVEDNAIRLLSFITQKPNLED